MKRERIKDWLRWQLCWAAGDVLIAREEILSYAEVAFELGCDGKAEKDAKRDMTVVFALVWQGLCKKLRKSLSFHCNKNVIYQVGK